MNEKEADLLRKIVAPGGRLNVDQVGKSPEVIATLAGFKVPKKTRALIAQVSEVGKGEILSMETLSPILSLFVEDGWEAGCARCKEILAFGGIGHTLGIHATSERIIEAFALEKPAMRIVVNSVTALGSVGYTTSLFPAMTLGPGTIGGSITSDNISPLHLVNIKRLAFETRPINPGKSTVSMAPSGSKRAHGGQGSLRKDGRPTTPWMEEIDARLRERAGNPALRTGGGGNKKIARSSAPSPVAPAAKKAENGLSEEDIDRIAAKFRQS